MGNLAEKYLNIAGTIIIALDDKGNITLLNKKGYSVLGYEEGELIGKNWFETCLPKENLKEVNEVFKKSMEGKIKLVEHYENPVITKNGERRTISWYNTTLKDDENKIIGTLSSGEDITERKESEKALKESEEKYRTIFENIRDVVIYIDRKGRIVSISPNVEDVFGYRPEDIIGKNFMKLGVLKLKDAPKMFKVFNEAFIKKKAITLYEVDIKCKDGSLIPIEANTTLIRDEGKIIGMLTTIRDISQRKKAEEKYKKLFQSSRDAIMTLNPPLWRFTSGNQSTIEMFRCKNEKYFISHAPFELSPEKQPDGRPSKAKALEMINKAMKEGSSFFEWVHKRADGPDFPATVLLARVEIEKGKPFLQATVRDITERKKAEEEKAKLQDKLAQYTKKLEVKVKKLEKEKINMNEKEKLVLFGITAYPSLNDRELSKKINLKRSTITAIKHRLRKQNLYSTVNIPNLSALGCELLTIIYGNFAKRYEERVKHTKRFIKPMNPSMVFIHSADEGFVVLLASKNLVEYHKTTDELFSEYEDELLKEPKTIVHFPLELSTINRFFDYAHFLNQLFELNLNIESRQESKQKMKLTKNMKEILYSIVRYPEATTSELAKMLRLTRGTVRNNINLLETQRFVQRTVIPNLKKLKCVLAAFTHRRVSQDKADMNSPSLIFSIGNNKELGVMNVFKNYSSDIEQDGNALVEKPSTIRMPIDKTKVFKIEFAALTKKMLKIDYEL